MSLTDRVDAYQRRHRRAGYPIAVLYKFFDDTGGHLAALITYYGFLSLFPLLLLASTVLGLVLSDDPHAQQVVLSSALRQFPVIGGSSSRRAAVTHDHGGAATRTGVPVAPLLPDTIAVARPAT